MNDKPKKSSSDVEGGGAGHDVWVERDTPIGPVVLMANDDDAYYQQTFRNRAELEAFITSLRAAADEAWPSQTSPEPPRNLPGSCRKPPK